MMDFITHGLWHYVIGVGKYSGVKEVGKDSGHGTCESHLVSWHDM